MIRMLALLALTMLLAGAIGCENDDENDMSMRAGDDRVALAVSDADDVDDADDIEEVEDEIPLSEVPENVKKAALAAVPGIVFEEASRETEDGTLVYELEGEADGKEYEIEVTEAGEVIKIEVDDEDDDDDLD